MQLDEDNSLDGQKEKYKSKIKINVPSVCLDWTDAFM